MLFKLYFHKPAAQNSCYFISLFFYVEYPYNKPYQMPLKDRKEETKTKQLLSLFYVEVIIQFYGMNFLRFGYTPSHSSLFT